MMYNPQLETFLCVADAGSFNKAAATLYITPTAVVKQVNLLESSLGLTLFTRTHRGLVLTEAGKSLYKDSKYIIRYCKASVLRAKSAGGEERVIRIGTSPMTPGQFLVDLWPKVHSLCPDIKLSWYRMRTRRRTRGRSSQTSARTSTSWPVPSTPGRCRTGGARRCC